MPLKLLANLRTDSRSLNVEQVLLYDLRGLLRVSHPNVGCGEEVVVQLVASPDKTLLLESGHPASRSLWQGGIG